MPHASFFHRGLTSVLRPLISVFPHFGMGKPPNGLWKFSKAWKTKVQFFQCLEAQRCDALRLI